MWDAADLDCASVEDSVRADVAELRQSPFIKKGTQVIGLTYDVQTGKVNMVDDHARL